MHGSLGKDGGVVKQWGRRRHFPFVIGHLTFVISNPEVS
jgi:hypothetical protein